MVTPNANPNLLNLPMSPLGSILCKETLLRNPTSLSGKEALGGEEPLFFVLLALHHEDVMIMFLFSCDRSEPSTYLVNSLRWLFLYLKASVDPKEVVLRPTKVSVYAQGPTN